MVKILEKKSQITTHLAGYSEMHLQNQMNEGRERGIRLAETTEWDSTMGEGEREKERDRERERDGWKERKGRKEEREENYHLAKN